MEDLLLIILNAIFEIFGEFLLQFFAEILVEFFSRLARWLTGMVVPTAVKDEPDPVGMFVVYTVLGGLAGLVSVRYLPTHLIHAPSHRWLNLVITPLLMGWTMAALGAWHDKHGRRVVGLDKFLNGWSFALLFAIVRFVWCK